MNVELLLRIQLKDEVNLPCNCQAVILKPALDKIAFFFPHTEKCDE